MNKKKLPRTIMRTHDGGAASVGDAASESAVEQGKKRTTSSLPQAQGGLGNVIEMTPLQAARVEAGSAPPAAPATDARRRRAGALAIVSWYAAGSALGGMIPLPLVTFAGVTAIIVRMVKALSDHYGVPFEQDRARAIVVGLVGGAMPTGVAAVTTSTLSYILPPAAVMGVAVSAISAACFTRSVGRIFIEHFESGAKLEDVSATLAAQSLSAA
jgi:uncharacterized protein (DUF697 family)